jgi:hypothetical protein
MPPCSRPGRQGHRECPPSVQAGRSVRGLSRYQRNLTCTRPVQARKSPAGPPGTLCQRPRWAYPARQTKAVAAHCIAHLFSALQEIEGGLPRWPAPSYQGDQSLAPQRGNCGRNFYRPITLTKSVQRLSCVLPSRSLGLFYSTPECHLWRVPWPTQSPTRSSSPTAPTAACTP